MNRVCLLYVRDDEVIVSALSPRGNRRRCQSGLAVYALDSLDIVELLITAENRPACS